MSWFNTQKLFSFGSSRRFWLSGGGSVLTLSVGESGHGPVSNVTSINPVFKNVKKKRKRKLSWEVPLTNESWPSDIRILCS